MKKGTTIVALLFLLVIYGNLTTQYTHKKPNRKLLHTGSTTISVSQPQTKNDPRIKRLTVFFKSFHSPLAPLSEVFINEADRAGLDWRLLPVVSCVETSCGKNYKKNAFGWGSDTLDYGDDSRDISIIASRIKTLHYYEKYRQSRSLYDFAMAYNGEYAKDYTSKLTYFMEELNQ